MSDCLAKLSDREPPCAIECEMSLLGAMIGRPENIDLVFPLVSAGDFFEEKHAIVFDVLVGFWKNSEPLDLTLLVQRLSEAGELEKVGGPDYLVRLAEDASSWANAVHYAKHVQRTAQRRRAQEAIEGALFELKRPGADFGGLIDKLKTDLIEMEPKGACSPELVEAEDLVEHHPDMNPVVVDGLLRRSEVVNFVSASKIGKSWAAHDLAISAANGAPWFGMPTTRCRVLLVDAELHANTLAFRLRQTRDRLRLPLAGLTTLALRGSGLSLPHIEQVVRRRPKGTFGLIVLDPIYRLTPPDFEENSNDAQKQLFERLDRLACDSGAALVVIHHGAKGSAADKAVVDVGAGGGSQNRACDTPIVMREHEEEGCVVFEAKTRSFPPLAPFALRWAGAGWELAPDLDPSRLLRGSRRPKTDPDAPPVEPMTPERFAALVGAVPVTEPEILARIKALGHSKRQAKEDLDLAVAQGRVIRNTPLRRNEKTTYQSR